MKMKLFLGNEEANLIIILLSIIMKMLFFFTGEDIVVEKKNGEIICSFEFFYLNFISDKTK